MSNGAEQTQTTDFFPSSPAPHLLLPPGRCPMTRSFFFSFSSLLLPAWHLLSPSALLLPSELLCAWRVDYCASFVLLLPCMFTEPSRRRLLSSLMDAVHQACLTCRHTQQQRAASSPRRSSYRADKSRRYCSVLCPARKGRADGDPSKSAPSRNWMCLNFKTRLEERQNGAC